MSVSCSYIDGNASLKLYGLKLDTIRTIGPRADQMDLISPSTFEGWMTTMLGMLREGKQLYDDGLTEEEAVWRTSILDMEHMYEDEICTEYRRRARPEFYLGYLKCVEDKKWPNSLNKYTMGAKELHAFMEGTYCRRHFITENGYVGQGPPGLQVGDIAAIILGAEAPFLLRQCLEKYQVIGEAYIHGVMDGEWTKRSADIIEYDCC